MRRLGLIGGMSWESSAVYYRLINEGVRARRGGLASADLLLYSFDFAEIAALQAAADWAAAGARLGEAARRLEGGGAEALVLCTNTMHKCAEAIETAAAIPLLHIGDATAAAAKAAGSRRPLLLATRFTMEEAFYRAHLARLGVEAVPPEAEGRAEIHRVIYEELCQGVISPRSKVATLEMIGSAIGDGRADGVLLGCTEIGLLIGQEDLPGPDAPPVLDTTRIHADAAVAFALS